MFVKICGINLDRVLSGKIFHIRKGVLSTVLGWLVFCRLDTYMSNKKNKVVIPILLLFVVLHCANIYIYTRDHLIVAIDSILVKKIIVLSTSADSLTVICTCGHCVCTVAHVYCGLCACENPMFESSQGILKARLSIRRRCVDVSVHTL